MRLRAKLVALAVAVVALAGGGAVLSGANFSAQTSNPNNTFTAASSFGCATPGAVTVKLTSANTTAGFDSYVDQDAPNTNFGTASDLFVHSTVVNKARRTYVKFTLPAKPADCSVTDVKLRLWTSSSGAAGRTIQVFRAATAWTETGITWNNQPAPTGIAATNTSTSPAGMKEWTGAAMVQLVNDQYTTNNGFVLRDSNEVNANLQEQKYRSRNDGTTAQRPELVVTFG